ncbi:SDR family oxidoreductase [Blastococcus atacamensis]|uniref:SDR family oxidoreductase n=1 Tax=Blastococcus atacamensis TaxID=2070508 RepID=UPI0018E4D617|nr:SDR family oxidoreductase [Blastococcus atacamensis]
MISRSSPAGSILVTGAGRGIGRAVAERFLDAGWRVGLFDVDPAAVADVAAGRPNAVHGALDVRDEAQWGSALGRFCPDGTLDVLVNNAGVLASGPFAGIDAGTHRRQVDVNVTGVVLGALTGHEYLARAQSGLLLNLCSASALYGQPTLATYGATKAAVKSLTEALDLEWRADGVRVRSLLPLFVDTEMVTRDGAGMAPVKNLGVHLTPADVATAAWRVVHERLPLPRSPHRTVGRQTRVLAVASSVSPDWLNRLVVGRLGS